MYIVEKYNNFEINEKKIKIKNFIKNDDSLIFFVLELKHHFIAIQLPYLLPKELKTYNEKKTLVLTFDKEKLYDNNILNKLLEIEKFIHDKILKFMGKKLKMNTNLLVFNSSFKKISENKMNFNIKISNYSKPIAFRKNRKQIEFDKIQINKKIKSIISINTAWYKDGLFGINWKLSQIKN